MLIMCYLISLSLSSSSSRFLSITLLVSSRVANQLTSSRSHSFAIFLWKASQQQKLKYFFLSLCCQSTWTLIDSIGNRQRRHPIHTLKVAGDIIIAITYNRNTCSWKSLSFVFVVLRSTSIKASNVETATTDELAVCYVVVCYSMASLASYLFICQRSMCLDGSMKKKTFFKQIMHNSHRTFLWI